jgi:hypothetical protein
MRVAAGMALTLCIAVGCSRSVADAPNIAKQACEDWTHLRAVFSADLPSADKVQAIENTANSATNRDPMFVVLRDHLHFAALAVSNRDAATWARQAARVDADCVYVKEGTFRAHVNDSVGP